MRLHSQSRARSGVTLAEFAIVMPILLFVLFAVVIGGLGIFRYQQLAALAREASRWASLHGTQYKDDTGKPAATKQDVYDNAIAPMAVALDRDPTILGYDVTWNSSNSPYHTTISNNSVAAVGNTVTVTITYKWKPEAFFGAITITMQSSSTMPMLE
jgi:Flp pilus assembly protein TadG